MIQLVKYLGSAHKALVQALAPGKLVIVAMFISPALWNEAPPIADA